MAALFQLRIILLLLVSSPASGCKGKAASKAKAGAAAAQKNDNEAISTTNINMGMSDTNLLDGYHEETVIMSVAAVFTAAFIFGVIFYFVRRHGLCKKPTRHPTTPRDRTLWSNMSLRNLRSKAQDDLDRYESRFEDLGSMSHGTLSHGTMGHCRQLQPVAHAPRVPPAPKNRCQDMEDLTTGAVQGAS